MKTCLSHMFSDLKEKIIAQRQRSAKKRDQFSSRTQFGEIFTAQRQKKTNFF